MTPFSDPRPQPWTDPEPDRIDLHPGGEGSAHITDFQDDMLDEERDFWFHRAPQRAAATEARIRARRQRARGAEPEPGEELNFDE